MRSRIKKGIRNGQRRHTLLSISPSWTCHAEDLGHDTSKKSTAISPVVIASEFRFAKQSRSSLSSSTFLSRGSRRPSPFIPLHKGEGKNTKTGLLRRRLIAITEKKKVFAFAKKSLVLALTFITVFGGIDPASVFAATDSWQIRQEINIVDNYFSAATAVYATSSAVINIDTSKYSGTVTYYLEVEASSSSALTTTFYLVSPSGTTTSSFTGNLTTTVGLFRSAAITPIVGSHDYYLKIGNEAGATKSVKSARVIITQSFAGTANSAATSTETQIEIGNEETYTSAATSTFAAPKYWTYTASKWDGTLSVTAEVTYKTINASFSSSTAYTTSGTISNIAFKAGTASATIEMIGGGGSGGGGSSPAGDGGAGGQYALKNISINPNNITDTHTLVVAAVTTGLSAVGVRGATSTWDTSVIVAGGGNGGALATASTSGDTIGCVGDICRAGGNGGKGKSGGASSSGGGGAGTTAAGASATGVVLPGGKTALAGGAGGAGSATSNTAGGAGSTAGGGGGGGFRTSSTKAGGDGAQGVATTTTFMASTTIAIQKDDGAYNWVTAPVAYMVVGSAAGSSTRARSSSFTPVDGLHYRVVFRTGSGSPTYGIYNAKIIVDQTSATQFTKLEPQYLLAPEPLSVGTALQTALTKWDSTEWATTSKTFLFAVDAAASTVSTIELDTAAGTQVVGSPITNPATHATSSLLTMPANGNLDIKATTNQSPVTVYSARILAQITLVKAISGTVYASEGGSNIGSGKLIKAYKNGTTYLGATTTDSSGGYYLVASSSISNGDIITTYISGDSTKGSRVFITDGLATTTADIYGSELIVASATTSPISNANLVTGAVNSDTDINYSTSSASAITVASNIELHVWTAGQYAPAGNLTTQGTGSLHIDDNASSTLNGGGTYSIAGDIVVDTGATININDNTTISGGDITTAGTATATTTSGTPTVTVSTPGAVGGGTNAVTFYNLTESGSGIITANSNIRVYHTLTVGSGATFNPTGRVTTFYDGASISNSGTLYLGSTTIAGGVQTSSNFSFEGILTVNAGGTLAAAAGTITASSSNASITNNGTLYFNALTLANSAALLSTETFSFSNALTLNSGTAIKATAGTITASSSSATISNSGTLYFNNFTLANSAAFLAASTFSFGGALTLNSGTAIKATSGTITASSSSASLSNSGTLYFNNFTLDNSAYISGSQTFSFGGALTITLGSLLPTGGTITASSSGATISNAQNLYFNNLTLANSAAISGAQQWSFGGALTVNSGTALSPTIGSSITASSSGASITNNGTLNFYSLFTAGNGVNITSNVSFTWGGTLSINGSDTLAPSGGTITASSSNPLIGNSGTLTFNNLTVKSGSTLNANQNFSVAGILTVNGTYSPVGGTQTLSNTGTPLVITGTFAPNNAGDTVLYTGNGATITAANYGNLQLEPGGSTPQTLSSGTYRLVGDLTIGDGSHAGATANSNNPTINASSSITIAAGATFVAPPSNNITISGNFTNNGTFTHNSGTLVFTPDATSTISATASTTFNNIQITTAGKELRFQKHTGNNPLFTIAGAFTVTGQNGSNIYINSDTSGSKWLVYFNSTQAAITYANIKDGGCYSGSALVTLGTGMTNVSNNDSCWFAATINMSGTVYDYDQSSALVSSPTLKLAVNGTSQYSTTTAASGTFTFTNVTQPSNGDVLTAWIDNVAATFGSVVFKYGASCTGGTGSDCTGLSLSKNRVTLQNFNGGSIVNTDLANCDTDSGASCTDTDIPFTANGGVLTVLDASSTASTTLTIPSGVTLAPGGNVSTPKLNIAGTYTGASETLTLSSYGTSATCTSISAEPLCVSGTFTIPTTVNFSATTSTSTVNNLSYTNLQISPTTGSPKFVTDGTASASGGGSSAFGYDYTKTITIDHTKVSTNDQTDFPVLISLASSSLATTANGGHVRNSSGYDIVFTSDSSCASKLTWDMEKYTAATGEVVAWVKVSSLSHSVDTVIYMCYGSSTISSFQSTASSVWDTSYKAVYHLKESGNGTSGEFIDSTINANNGQGGAGVGANTPTQLAAGFTGAANTFDGTNDIIDGGNTSSLTITGALTISAWVRLSSSYSHSGRIVAKSGGGGLNIRGYEFDAESDGTLFLTVADASGVDFTVGTTQLAFNRWYYITAVYSPSVSGVVYVNGVATSTNSTSVPSSIQAPAQDFLIGARNAASPSSFFQGDIDQVEVSGTNRGADWVATEYNNQSATSTFYSVSTEQSHVSYSYSRSITINHSYVSTSDQTNFPVLVSLASSTFAYTANGGHVQNSNGYDIAFGTNSSCGTELSWELEKYASTTGEVVAWVKIPTLSQSSDTTLYICYGNSSISTLQSASSSVWDSNYKGVWHMAQNTGSNLFDSTINGNTFTQQNSPTQTAGKIGGSFTFNGTTQAFDRAAGTSPTLDMNGLGNVSFTQEGWFKTTDSNADVMFSSYNSNTDYTLFQLSASVAYGSWRSTTGNGDKNTGATTYADGNWHHIAWVQDDTVPGVILYVDGTPFSATQNHAAFTQTDQHWVIGAEGTSGATINFTSGQLDEFRFSHSARSAGWITTEYNNQSVTSTFYSLGAEQSHVSYSYYRPLTIQASQVSTSDQTNFPVLVSLVNSTLATTGNGGHVQNTHGYDIAFGTDSSCLTELNWETEKYVSTNGEIEAWVKIPTLSHSANTVIYMCYGASGISTFQSATTSVWSSYKGVWHLADGTTLSGYDSSPSGNNGTNHGAPAAAGKIDGGMFTNGNSIQYLSMGDPVGLRPVSNDFTISGWGKTTAAGAYQTILSSYNGNTDYVVLRLDLGNHAEFSWGDHSQSGTVDTTSTFNDGNWHYFVGVHDRSGANKDYIYVDGTATSLATAASTINTDSQDWEVGAQAGGTVVWGGTLDEVKYSHTARSGDWVTTEYNNQGATSTFYQLGDEVSNGVVTITYPTLTISGNLTLSGSGSPYFDLFNNLSNLTIGGDITITSGTLSAGSTTTLSGNFSNSGTFTPNTGTFVVSPTASSTVFSGGSNTSFYNFTASNAGKSLLFGSGNVYTFSGALNFSGSSGNPLYLLSNSRGSQWIIKYLGTITTLSNTVVRDAGCDASSYGLAMDTSDFDAGNNGSCWGFISHGVPFGAYGLGVDGGLSGGGTVRTGGGQGAGALDGGVDNGGSGGGDNQGGGGQGGGGGGSTP